LLFGYFSEKRSAFEERERQWSMDLEKSLELEERGRRGEGDGGEEGCPSI